MSRLPRRTAIRSHAVAFSAGFVLGAAFMASPALGMILVIAAIGYIFASHLK